MRHTVEARIGDADENMADADTIERKLFLFQWRNLIPIGRALALRTFVRLCWGDLIWQKAVNKPLSYQ